MGPSVRPGTAARIHFDRGRAWWFLAAGVVGGWLLGGLALLVPWIGAADARAWAVVTLAVAGLLGGITLGLVARHGPGSAGWPTPATAVTLFRGLLLAAVAGFIAVEVSAGPAAWLPGALFGAAVALDAVDGVLARRREQVTRLGERLDLEFDAAAIAIGSVLGVVAEVLPVWYLAAGGARYAFAGGVYLRRRADRPVRPLPPSAVRRPLAGLQMAVLAVALIPVTAPPLTVWLATAALVPFLAGFVRDWLAVSGRPAPDAVSRSSRQDDRR